MLRAGFTEVFITGILIRWIRARQRPITEVLKLGFPVAYAFGSQALIGAVNWRQCTTVCAHSRRAETSVRYLVINLPR